MRARRNRFQLRPTCPIPDIAPVKVPRASPEWATISARYEHNGASWASGAEKCGLALRREKLENRLKRLRDAFPEARKPTSDDPVEKSFYIVPEALMQDVRQRFTTSFSTMALLRRP